MPPAGVKKIEFVQDNGVSRVVDEYGRVAFTENDFDWAFKVWQKNKSADIKIELDRVFQNQSTQINYDALPNIIKGVLIFVDAGDQALKNPSVFSATTAEKWDKTVTRKELLKEIENAFEVKITPPVVPLLKKTFFVDSTLTSSLPTPIAKTKKNPIAKRSKKVLRKKKLKSRKQRYKFRLSSPPSKVALLGATALAAKLYKSGTIDSLFGPTLPKVSSAAPPATIPAAPPATTPAAIPAASPAATPAAPPAAIPAAPPATIPAAPPAAIPAAIPAAPPAAIPAAIPVATPVAIPAAPPATIPAATPAAPPAANFINFTNNFSSTGTQSLLTVAGRLVYVAKSIGFFSKAKKFIDRTKNASLIALAATDIGKIVTQPAGLTTNDLDVQKSIVGENVYFGFVSGDVACTDSSYQTLKNWSLQNVTAIDSPSEFAIAGQPQTLSQINENNNSLISKRIAASVNQGQEWLVNSLTPLINFTISTPLIHGPTFLKDVANFYKTANFNERNKWTFLEKHFYDAGLKLIQSNSTRPSMASQIENVYNNAVDLTPNIVSAKNVSSGLEQRLKLVNELEVVQTRSEITDENNFELFNAALDLNIRQLPRPEKALVENVKTKVSLRIDEVAGSLEYFKQLSSVLTGNPLNIRLAAEALKAKKTNEYALITLPTNPSGQLEQFFNHIQIIVNPEETALVVAGSQAPIAWKEALVLSFDLTPEESQTALRVLNQYILNYKTNLMTKQLDAVIEGTQAEIDTNKIDQGLISVATRLITKREAEMTSSETNTLSDKINNAKRSIVQYYENNADLYSLVFVFFTLIRIFTTVVI